MAVLSRPHRAPLVSVPTPNHGRSSRLKRSDRPPTTDSNDSRSLRTDTKGGFDPDAPIVDMDSDGIDAAFLYPSLGLFTGAVEAPDLAAAMCRAYNRWLADYCKPYPDRL